MVISKNNLILGEIKKKDFIIWDFDGVIKDSVDIKGKLFVNLFHNENKDIKEKIYKHHQDNGGLSRVEKLKIYLNWSTIASNQTNLNNLIKEYNSLCFQNVINCSYVDGVFEFLKNNHKSQIYFLVSSSPHHELIEITKRLEIFSFFREIYGYPNLKVKCFESIKNKCKGNFKNIIAIGDSYSDYLAAKKSNIDFVLKINSKTPNLPKWYIDEKFYLTNFIYE